MVTYILTLKMKFIKFLIKIKEGAIRKYIKQMILYTNVLIDT